MKRLFLQRKIWAAQVGVAIALLLVVGAVSAQEISPTAQVEALKIKAIKETLPPYEQKFNSTLYNVLQEMKAASITRENATQRSVKEKFSTPLVDVDENGRIHVTLRVTRITPSLLSQLVTLEFEVEATTEDLKVTPNHQMISGWAFFDRLEDIAKLSPIFHIRPVDKPILLAGDVTSAGDTILRADLARSTFNVDGSGQKVGVISDGVDHRDSSQVSGDLPPTIDVVNNRFRGDEGTAMLEIVHDLAPGANLAFADYGSSQADFANNINLLQGAGCTIICDDILYLLEPVYEDGLIAQTVDNVVDIHDVVYISSAGNYHGRHYEGEYIDTDGDGWHDFIPGDETINTVLGPGDTIKVVLQWNNEFGKSSDDYDIYIYDDPPNNVLASSTDIQDGDDDPVEFVTYVNPDTSYSIILHIAVWKKGSAAARDLSIYMFGPGVEPQEYVDDDGAIYGHAAAQKCLAIGAIDAADPGNDDIEPFSSHGPSRIYFYDASGNPTGFVDRPKPDHVAIDGVETKVGQMDFFSNPFFGTSAAAAHTAAIAALVRQAKPSLMATQVGDVLNVTAIDLPPLGFDNVSGNGRIDAYNAVRQMAQWTFMVYLDGDNNLESAAISDFLEMASIGSNEDVKIVALLDRADGYYHGYDDWTEARRGIIDAGDEPDSAWGESIGEVNMGDPQTLIDFVEWGMRNYPAYNYAVVLWNHGGGWRKAKAQTTVLFNEVCLDSTDSDILYMQEVRNALATIEVDVQQLDLVGFDACLMGMVEVAYEIRQHARVMVGSEETEPGDGWPYDTILADLVADPSMNAEDLGRTIVSRYGGPTMSAVRLGLMDNMAVKIDELAQTLRSSWDSDIQACIAAAEQVMAAIDSAVIAEEHGALWPGSHGLAIYFPETSGDFDSDYNGSVILFPGDTRWDEFLQDFYAFMSDSWIARIRDQTQEYSVPEHVDLYDFCEKLSMIGGIDVALVLDRSGSMDGSKIEAAKNASDQFIALMQLGDELAVTSFSSSATVDFPMTVITSEATKTAAQEAVNSLIADGWTSIGAGIQTGQGQLDNVVLPNFPQAMILLSDGLENTAPFVADVLPTIPATTDIYTIALGADADQGLLNDIAAQTGGIFLFSPGPEELQSIYDIIRNAVTGRQIVASFEGNIDQGQTVSHSASVDSLSTEATFTLLWSGSDLDLVLVDPNGTTIDSSVAATDPNITFTQSSIAESYTVTSPLSGEWILQITGVEIPSGSEPYTASVSVSSELRMEISFDQESYVAGDTIVVSARLTEDGSPLTGATVSAEVEVPATTSGTLLASISDLKKEGGIPEDVDLFKEGGIEGDSLSFMTTDSLELFDDGAHGDGAAADGVYANFFTNTLTPGSYTFRVRASGTAPIGGPFSREGTRSTFVAEPPDILLSTTELDFGEVFVGASSDLVLIISNVGSSDLNITSIVSDNSDFVPGITGGTVPPDSSMDVRITFAPSTADTIIGTLTIASNDPDERTVSVALEGRGTYPPSITVSPDTLSETVVLGDSTSRTLSIGNTGRGELRFDIEIASETSRGDEKVMPASHKYPSDYYNADVGKGEEDFRKGAPVTSGIGGPDSFGYRWIDSDEPGGPAFDYQDISSTGILVTGLSDDSYAGPFPIGFDFPYYGQVHSQFYISSNGFIGFGPVDGYSDYTNDPIPSTSAPNNILAWCWGDLYPYSDSYVYYQTVGDKLIIQFVNYGEFGASGRVDAEVILFADGRILYQYRSFTGGFDTYGCTVGIENEDGTDGLEVAFNTSYLHDSLAVEFSRRPDWVTVIPSSGTVSPDSSQDVTVGLKGISYGDHYARLLIHSNDPDTTKNPYPVTVHLHVLGVPDIEVSPDTLDFGECFVLSGAGEVVVYNRGTDLLSVTSVSCDTSVFVPDTTAFDVDPGDSVIVRVAFSPVDTGFVEGRLTIVSNDPDEPTVDVVLRGAGIFPPDIHVEPTSLSLAAAQGDSTSGVITIHNNGEGILRYTITTKYESNSTSSIPLKKAGFRMHDFKKVPYHPERIIVKFKPGVKTTVIRRFNTENKVRAIKYYPLTKACLLKVPQGLSVEDAVAIYNANPDVEYAEPDYVVHAFGMPNDPSFSSLWGLHNTGQTGGTVDADVDAPEAWDMQTGSSSVLIGIIDTGIDYNHPDLAANIWTNPGEVPGNGIDDDGNGYVDDIHGWDFCNDDNDPMDDNGHGTHCAGIIAAVGNNGLGVVGVNWTAKLVALKFLDQNGYGYTSDEIEALSYATMMGIRVTNNSYGGTGYSQAEYDAIMAAARAGALFVTGAGNGGDDNIGPGWDNDVPGQEIYPSSYDCPNIISAAATDDDDLLTSYSNWGAASVDLGAPGDEIYSTILGGYGYKSGASMATAYVTGVVGLCLAQAPSLGYMEIKEAILEGTDPDPSLAGKVVTGGRLNAYKALTSLTPHWLSVTPSSGTVGPHTSVNIRLTARATGLEVDTTYHAAVLIYSNDPDEGTDTVSVSFSVFPPGLADIEVEVPSPLAVSLSSDSTMTLSQGLLIRNTGDGVLNFDISFGLEEVASTASSEFADIDIGKRRAGGSPASSSLGDVVTSFPAPALNPQGLAFGGGYLWSVCPDGIIYQIDPADGSVVNSFPIPSSSPDGLASDGTFLWLADDEAGMIYKLSQSDGSVVDSIPAPSDHIEGVGWDGVYIWCDDYVSGKIYKINVDGSVLDSLLTPSSMPRGLTFARGYIWYGDSNGFIYQVNPQDGSVVSSFAGPGGDPQGLAWDGNYLWIASAATSMLYKVDVEMATISWLSVEPRSGFVEPGDSLGIAVTFDAAGLEVGRTYTTSIVINSNDTDEGAVSIPASLRVPGGLDICGRLIYYSTGSGMDSSAVTAFGDSAFVCSDTTDADGSYCLRDLPMGSYTVRPSRNGGVGRTITPYDAALVLKHYVGLDTLDCYQRIAADVTGDGEVSPFDAAKILQYFVGSIDGFPVGRDWKFVPVSFAVNDTNWATAPDSVVFSPLVSDTTADFYGIVYGDVSGNWSSTPGKLAAATDVRTVSLGDIPGEESTVTLPVEIDNGSGIVSAGLTINYDPSVLRATGASTTELTSGYLLAKRIREGEVKIALAGAKPLKGGGPLLNLSFEVLKPVDRHNSSVITISDCQLNEGRIPAVARSGHLVAPRPTEFALFQNYPNPFNPTTTIEYQLPVEAKVKLEIYNLLGQRVRRLVNQRQQAGYYTVRWNGKDEAGREVAAGIYLYRLEAGKFSQIRKMLLIR